jgi:hypothetical protein
MLKVLLSIITFLLYRQKHVTKACYCFSIKEIEANVTSLIKILPKTLCIFLLFFKDNLSRQNKNPTIMTLFFVISDIMIYCAINICCTLILVPKIF